jgi:hypothetical protein
LQFQDRVQLARRGVCRPAESTQLLSPCTVGSSNPVECLRLGLADEIRYSILPILIGDGIPFFAKLDKDIALHLAEVKAYKSGMVELRYDVRGDRGEAGNAT